MADMDTVNKRRTSTMYRYFFPIWPVPDGTIGEDDRRQVNGIYPTAGPVPAVEQTARLMMMGVG